MGTRKYEAQRRREFKTGGCAVGDGSSLIDVEVDLFVSFGFDGKWRGPDPADEWTEEDGTCFDEHFTGSEFCLLCAKGEASWRS